MPQTRMFRDRVVSMEQTLEGGEKNLEMLKAICREALPEFQYREHALDHERDLFVMVLEAPDGRRKTVGWTRMVLFDAERLPALAANADPASPLRARLVAFLRSRSGRAEIVVTFRHMEEGWSDTPEPRREKRRGRRGRSEAKGERPQPRPSQQQPRVSRPAPPPPGGRPAQTPPAPAGAAARPPGRRRRRFRRRRRGPGGGSPPSSPGSGPAGPQRAP